MTPNELAGKQLAEYANLMKAQENDRRRLDRQYDYEARTNGSSAALDQKYATLKANLKTKHAQEIAGLVKVHEQQMSRAEQKEKFIQDTRKIQQLANEAMAAQEADNARRLLEEKTKQAEKEEQITREVATDIAIEKEEKRQKRQEKIDRLKSVLSSKKEEKSEEQQLKEEQERQQRIQKEAERLMAQWEKEKEQKQEKDR